MSTKQPRRLSTEAERQRAIQLYTSDPSVTVRDVAAALGRSPAWVSQVISPAGVARPRGGDRRSAPEADRARAVELYQSLRSVRRVAKELGRGLGFVHEAVRGAGIEMNPPGRQPRTSLQRVA